MTTLFVRGEHGEQHEYENRVGREVSLLQMQLDLRARPVAACLCDYDTYEHATGTFELRSRDRFGRVSLEERYTETHEVELDDEFSLTVMKIDWSDH